MEQAVSAKELRSYRQLVDLRQSLQWQSIKVGVDSNGKDRNNGSAHLNKFIQH